MHSKTKSSILTAAILVTMVTVTMAQDDDIIDMTQRHAMSEVQHFPPFGLISPIYEQEVVSNGSDPDTGIWSEVNRVTMFVHAGTHVDAPCHFTLGGARMHEIPYTQFVGESVVIDISEQCEQDPDYEMTVEDIDNWVQENGQIPEGAFIMLNTGGEWRYNNNTLYWGSDGFDPADYHHPGVAPEACQYMVDNLNIKAIGTDWGIIDSAEAGRRPAEFQAFCHRVLLGNNVLIYEFVSNINQLPPRGYTIYGLPLKLENTCGAPVRMIAVRNPEGHGYMEDGAAGQTAATGVVMAAAILAFMLGTVVV